MLDCNAPKAHNTAQNWLTTRVVFLPQTLSSGVPAARRWIGVRTYVLALCQRITLALESSSLGWLNRLHGHIEPAAQQKAAGYTVSENQVMSHQLNSGWRTNFSTIQKRTGPRSENFLFGWKVIILARVLEPRIPWKGQCDDDMAVL